MPKILLVDDDPDVITILTQILEYEKYDVTSVSDGEQALKKLQKERPDLVITDIMIPRMDGWRLCKKIKEIPSLKNVPILIMTAKTDDINELMSYESGGDAYITKPFENREFVETVRGLLGKKP